MAACVGVWGPSSKEIIQVVNEVGDVVIVAEDPHQWLKSAGDDRRPKGRHLSRYHWPSQWMARRCQSSLRTGMMRKAFFRSNFPISALGPITLRMAMAESMVQ